MSVALGRTGLWCMQSAWPDDPAAVADTVAEIEDLGYRSLWLGISPPSLELPEALLKATASLRVATGIVSVWDAPAEVLAAASNRVQRAYPGRFLLGLGASHAHVVERGGQRYHRPYTKLAGYLDELDASEPAVSEQDRALAALGPRVLALAGQRSAGAHPYLVPVEHTRRAREILGAGPLLAPELMVVLETDASRAREIARAAIAPYLRAPNYVNNLLRLGYSEDAVTSADDALVDAIVAWGDEAAVARRVAEHHAAGADHVCVQVLTGEATVPLAQYRRLAPTLSANG